MLVNFFGGQNKALMLVGNDVFRKPINIYFLHLIFKNNEM